MLTSTDSLEGCNTTVASKKKTTQPFFVAKAFKWNTARYLEGKRSCKFCNHLPEVTPLWLFTTTDTQKLALRKKST